MSDFIRIRQRAVTAVTPHNANRRVLVPNHTLHSAQQLHALMLVGTDTAEARGYVQGLYGDLTPNEYIHDEIVRVSMDSDLGDEFGLLRFLADGKVHGTIESFAITFADLPITYPALWSESQPDSFYRSGDDTAGLLAYLDAELGNLIPVHFRVLEFTSALGFDWATAPDEGFLVDYHQALTAAQLAEYQDTDNWRVSIPPFNGAIAVVQNVDQLAPARLFVDIPNGAATPGDLARVTYTAPSALTQPMDRITPTSQV